MYAQLGSDGWVETLNKANDFRSISATASRRGSRSGFVRMIVFLSAILLLNSYIRRSVDLFGEASKGMNIGITWKQSPTAAGKGGKQ